MVEENEFEFSVHVFLHSHLTSPLINFNIKIKILLNFYQELEIFNFIFEFINYE